MTETTDIAGEQVDAAAATFGRYQLLERVGQGGMAEVFKARINAAAGTEKLVCIKRILPHLSRSGDFTSLFVSEARITLPLTHGNITQVFDFGEVDQTYYLAMEFVHGQNLARVIEQRRQAAEPLDVAAALYIAAEVCRGLQYAHTFTDEGGRPAPVIHCDVSPHNVLISYHGEVKLTDFGIARAASRVPDGGQVVRGKPCYVSPEQASGQNGDARSDVFSLGAVLYEMLTGVRVFEGESDLETLEKVRSLAVPPPSAHNREVGEKLDEIVLKALSKDPAARFQSAGELQVELSRFLHQASPAFTADGLARLMKDLFAWELQAERGNGAARDRLLFQLSRAGVQVDDGNVSTDELLQMGTVALSGKGRAGERQFGNDRDARLWPPWLAVGAVLITGAIAAGTYALRGTLSSEVGSPNPRAAATGPSPSELTEHLVPPSLKRAEQSGTADERAAAAAMASGAVALPARAEDDHPATRRRAAGPAIRVDEVAQAARMGYLNCNSWPWSVVYLDGKRLAGNTPLYRVETRAGSHKLRFVNPELGLSREINVMVEAGVTKTVAVKLLAGAAASAKAVQ